MLSKDDMQKAHSSRSAGRDRGGMVSIVVMSILYAYGIQCCTLFLPPGGTALQWRIYQ